MSYKLFFLPEARQEWDGLDGSLRTLFKAALKKRLETPRLPGSQLRPPLVDCYKIKLRGVGYRLVYLVRDEATPPDIVVLVVGRRDGGIYEAAAEMLESGRNVDK
ncbi:type II toxin-antitoxin system RelE/ParE family toxin [Pigmentiphaga sp. GD03639]|jgi:mRNA interferase RelE/StbE|uniref:Type II toxin-antitoxin system RelE/ParE family toxin n=1 Tax=Pigmentiphaga daeguensis TaxID=414049 RepID=A0ABN1BAB1_9BURK|nr:MULTISPECIES: type II toxin-antitoxin system RelE/ParE family toxin [unclassified Pigmentiphaga]MDH2237717.1 type II toxin-antitoxin system RelE/ParE family toxin [Pigmentiphaga sp. GD03639]OVZ62247.1 hypothetical protein CDO46_16560 [Pigmentiphaga sp. NML030171]